MPKASSKSKCWRAFAEYIRLRDSEGGYCKCISCGRLVTYPNDTGKLHAGHYYPRSVTYNSLYFDERNVNGQCAHCNTYLQGNAAGYLIGLKAKWGDDVIEILDKKRSGFTKIHDFEFDEMAKMYRKESRAMKKARGL